MPKRCRGGLDRRPRQPAEPEEESMNEDQAPAPLSQPRVDVVAFCSACGQNDPSMFSRRMLERRGRHGERTRRCRSCIEDGRVAEPEAPVFLPSSVLHSSVNPAAKARVVIPSRWEAAEAAHEESVQKYLASKNLKRPRTEQEEWHKSATFTALSCAGDNPKRKKESKSSRTEDCEHAVSSARPSVEPRKAPSSAFNDLLSHIGAFKSLYH